MDFFTEGDIIIMTFMVMLLGSWAVVASAPRHKYVPLVEYEQFEFDLNKWSPERLRRTMRFTKEEIRLLIGYFDLESIEYRGRIRPSPGFALCLLLCKLSWPRPLFELTEYFGRSETYLSIVLNDVLEHLGRRYDPMLSWHPMLTYNRIRLYARTVKRLAGHAGRSTVWAFLDGTFRRTARPEKKQDFWYSAYKKSHGMAWMAVTCPDGLIGASFGPYEAAIADVKMLERSGIVKRLDRMFRNKSRRYYLFGDKAYIHQRHVMSPYMGYASERDLWFNKKMSSARVTVEHGFGRTQNLWISNALKQQLKMGLQPVGGLYRAAILLTNCYTCFRGNEDATRFGIRPPTIHQYLDVIA